MSPTPTPRNRAAVEPRVRQRAVERREHVRFPISMPAEYVLGCVRGSAVTCDLSSGGIFVKADRLLPIGKRVDLYIDWPAVLDDRAALRLVVKGLVLRSGWRGSAIRIAHYEFRVRSRRG